MIKSASFAVTFCRAARVDVGGIDVKRRASGRRPAHDEVVDAQAHAAHPVRVDGRHGSPQALERALFRGAKEGAVPESSKPVLGSRKMRVSSLARRIAAAAALSLSRASERSPPLSRSAPIRKGFPTRAAAPPPEPALPTAKSLHRRRAGPLRLFFLSCSSAERHGSERSGCRTAV